MADEVSRADRAADHREKDQYARGGRFADGGEQRAGAREREGQENGGSVHFHFTFERARRPMLINSSKSYIFVI